MTTERPDYMPRDGLITREGDRRWLTGKGREWLSRHWAAA